MAQNPVERKAAGTVSREGKITALLLLKNFYDEVAKVSYELYENRGRVHGQDREDWFKAEMIVKKRYSNDIEHEPQAAKSNNKAKPGNKKRN